MQLPTIGDRIPERFVRPFRARPHSRGTVAAGRAGTPQRRVGEDAPEQLEREIEAYAATPTGSGLDVPQWLVSLASEVRGRVEPAANTPAAPTGCPSIRASSYRTKNCATGTELDEQQDRRGVISPSPATKRRVGRPWI